MMHRYDRDTLIWCIAVLLLGAVAAPIAGIALSEAYPGIMFDTPTTGKAEVMP